MSIALAPVLLPLALLVIAVLASLVIGSALLTIPVLPLYIGGGYDRTKQLNKINPIYILMEEIFQV